MLICWNIFLILLRNIFWIMIIVFLCKNVFMKIGVMILFGVGNKIGLWWGIILKLFGI